MRPSASSCVQESPSNSRRSETRPGAAGGGAGSGAGATAAAGSSRIAGVGSVENVTFLSAGAAARGAACPRSTSGRRSGFAISPRRRSRPTTPPTIVPAVARRLLQKRDRGRGFFGPGPSGGVPARSAR